MELLSAESWSVFLLALVPVMALATLAGIALAVILEDLGRAPRLTLGTPAGRDFRQDRTRWQGETDGALSESTQGGTPSALFLSVAKGPPRNRGQGACCPLNGRPSPPFLSEKIPRQGHLRAGE